MYIDDFDGSEHPICNYWFIRITSCFIFNFMNLEFYKVVWGQQFIWNLLMVSRNDRPSVQKICQYKMCSVVYIKSIINTIHLRQRIRFFWCSVASHHEKYSQWSISSEQGFYRFLTPCINPILNPRFSIKKTKYKSCIL